MNFDSNTPRAERTIAGRKVQVIQPFAEGHVLTPALAAILNQTIAENFSNNLRKAVEAGVTEGEGDAATQRPFTDDEVQQVVDKYMAEYEPGVRRTGESQARVVDPVEREARKLAKAKVLEVIKSKGLKAKDVDVAGLTSQLFDKNRDAFMAQGKKVVKALEAAATASAGGDFELDLTPSTEAA